MIENEPPLATHEAMDPLDVCTLDPDEFADRLRWIREKILRHALGKERLEDGIAIEVSNAPGMSERIDRWIELERTCCEGIRFERHAGPTRAQLRIEIHGIDPQGRLFGGLPDLLRQTRTVRQNPISRILRAGGLGAVASVFFLCVLPIGIASLLGATAAATPLVWLDDPLWIGFGALVGAGLGWLWLGRRRGAES